MALSPLAVDFEECGRPLVDLNGGLEADSNECIPSSEIQTLNVFIDISINYTTLRSFERFEF